MQTQTQVILNNPHICAVPFGAITIGPGGELKVCCRTTEWPSHISKWENLNDWFNGAYLENIRYEFKNNLWPSACKKCKFQADQGITPQKDLFYFNQTPVGDNPTAKKKQIHFLEFTPSNLCNQTCVMCGSGYSSKWYSFDKKAVEQGLTFRARDDGLTNIHRKPYQMSEEDFQKVLDILPNVKTLSLKGGEPFAEPRNIKILQHCIKHNINLDRLFVTSNIHAIQDSTWDYLTFLKRRGCNIIISCSLDGTGKTYEWIRSTPFDKTIDNLQKGFKLIGRESFVVLMTVCLYNFFDVNKDTHFWLNKMNVRKLCYNYVYGPSYVSPSLMPSNLIDPVIKNWKQSFGTNDRLDDTNNFTMIKHVPAKDTEYKEIKQWLNYVNNMRGFDILAYQPKLKEWLDTI